MITSKTLTIAHQISLLSGTVANSPQFSIETRTLLILFVLNQGMETMPTFTPSGGHPLLVRGTIQENFGDSMPLTSRYAWPQRSESSLSGGSFPSRKSNNPFFGRHNPHPQRVRHLKGLLDIPVCTVIDSGVEENVGRFMVSTPTTDQMRQRPLRLGLRMPINAESFVYAKEKAVPSIGLVPITQTWREELRKFTEAAAVKSKNPYTITTSYHVPLSRQGSRQGPRTPPSRGGELPPPSRSGEKPPSQHGESRFGNRPLTSRQGPPMQHIAADTNGDANMVEMLAGILQTDSFDAIKFWLVNAPETEKKLVLDMIRAVSVSDHEFREGFNEMIRPPVYDDQLLQQESSLDVDEIQKYNDMKRREKEVEAEEDRKKKEQDDSYQKPKTPRTAESQGYTQYKWTSPAYKPSSPFIATEKKKEILVEQNKPRPGTAEAEIEEIRGRLMSRSSPRVFAHQKVPGSRHSARPQTQQSLYIPPAEVLEPAAQRPPSHQSIKSQQSVIRSILSYKPQQY